jgi:hypothetical protein
MLVLPEKNEVTRANIQSKSVGVGDSLGVKHGFEKPTAFRLLTGSAFLSFLEGKSRTPR